jgi:hypothetical protein
MAKGIDINLSPAEIKRRLDSAIEVEQTEKQKTEAKRVDNELDQRARRAFFSSRPGASEVAYQAVADELKRSLVVDDAKRADERANGPLHSIYREL